MRIKLFLFLILAFPSFVISQTSNLKIGLSLPLSGPLSEYGVAVRNAFSMAVEELGSEGYELIYEDNQYDGKTTVTTFKTLSEIKKVDLIYLWGEVGLYSIAPLSTAKKIPILVMSVGKRSAKGHPYVIRAVNPSEEFIGMVYKFLRSSNNNGKPFKKIGIIMSEDPYFEGLLVELQSQVLPGEEIKVVARVPAEQMDLKTEIIKAKATKLDILAVYLNPGQVSAAYRAIRNLRYTIPTIGTDTLESSNEVKDSQGSMVGAKYHNLKMPEEFGERYLKKFGNDLQITYAYNAYTTAKFLISKINELKVAKENGKDLKDEIVELLLTEKDLPFEVKKDGDFGYYFSYPLVMKEVRVDGFVNLK